MDLTPIKQDEFAQMFELFKASMFPIIDEALGWDEAFQERNFKQHLKPEWFYWVEVDGERVGVVCHRYKEASLHIHLLAIFRPYQGHGYAQQVLVELERMAASEGKVVTLSCFKNNQRAVKLYRTYGFKVLGEDDLFYDFGKVSHALASTL